jgi:hypothetical protein
MQQRQQFIDEHLEQQSSLSEVCRRFGMRRRLWLFDRPGAGARSLVRPPAHAGERHRRTDESEPRDRLAKEDPPQRERGHGCELRDDAGHRHANETKGIRHEQLRDDREQPHGDDRGPFEGARAQSAPTL